MVDFPVTTIWRRIHDSLADPAALHERIVRRYRAPVVAFARTRGISPEDAEDIAQEVFTRVCQPAFLERADATRGRFRSLLLGVTRKVIASAQRHDGAQRRDREREVPFDEAELAPDAGEASAFDRLWVRALVDQALERLAGDPAVQALTLQLDGASYQDIAQRLGRKESDITNAIHRSKPRVRKEIERLVAEYATPDDAEEELRTLLRQL